MSNAAAARIARAESVGSLIRPPGIVQRMDALYAGMTAGSPQLVLPQKAQELADLNRALDEATRELVRRQVEIGMDIVNDGEIRRTVFTSPMLDAIDEISLPESRPAVAHRDGTEHEYIGEPLFAGRIRQVRNPLVEEATVMRQLDIAVPFKITIPSATVPLWFGVAGGVPEGYESAWEMGRDGLELLRAMVAEIVAAGITYVQFDLVPYANFDPDQPFSAHMVTEPLGVTIDELLDRMIEFDQRVVEGLPDDVTFGAHICRGNDFPGGKGVLVDDVAERMFAEVPYHRWLIEWYDPDRHGDFSALRFVPEGKVVVLGLVDTKTDRLESEDEILRKIEEASQYAPIERLALSPQCGFSSAVGFEQVDGEEMQWRKLELVRKVADRVWGR